MSIAEKASSFGTTPTAPAHPMPVPVQVLSTILFAAFAIPVTIVALNVFWPAGIVLAVILAWRGGFAPYSGQAPSPAAMDKALQTVMPAQAQKASGNASFDAYRRGMLERLETEQQNFEAFVGRLRDAKDKSEFDNFMDARAKITREAAQETPALA